MAVGLKKSVRGEELKFFGIFAGGRPAANQRPHTDFRRIFVYLLLFWMLGFDGSTILHEDD